MSSWPQAAREVTEAESIEVREWRDSGIQFERIMIEDRRPGGYSGERFRRAYGLPQEENVETSE